MKYNKAIFFTFLMAWAHVAPAYFVSQPRYKTCTRVLGVSALALLLPLGYAYKQWRDVKKLKPHEQKTTDARKKKKRAIITASISAALLALTGIAYYLINPCPMRQLSVLCQINNCTPDEKQCGYGTCGAAINQAGRTTPCSTKSCGWWALLNAWAIQKLSSEGQPITSQAVAHHVQSQQNLIDASRELYDVEMQHHAAQNATKIENQIFLIPENGQFKIHCPINDEQFNSVQAQIANPEANNALFDAIEANFTGPNNNRVNTIVQRLNTPAEQLNASFMCRINGNHWTSVTVKKQHGQNPELFYCDSWFNNQPPQALSKFMKEKFPTARAVYTAEPPVSVQPPVVPQPPAAQPAPRKPSTPSVASTYDQKKVDLEERRKLREEQDRAYEEALAADRAKDAEKTRIAREAIEKEHAEAERIKRETDEAQQREQVNREKMRNRWKGPQ